MNNLKSLILTIFVFLCLIQVLAQDDINVSHDAQPQWSPSGNQIAFVSDRDSSSDLWLTDLTINTRQNLTKSLTEEPKFITDIEWNNNEKQILFTLITESNADIWLYSLEDDELVNLTKSADSIESNPKWSNLNDKISYISNESGNTDIWMMDINGDNKENLTLSDSDEFSHYWSHDGKYISYSATDSSAFTLYILDVESNEVIVVDEDSGDAVWSPDDCCLAYVRYETNSDIYLYRLDDQTTQNLTEYNRSNNLLPIWSPNGNLYFISEDIVESAIVVYSLEMSAPQLRIEHDITGRPISVSPNDTIAFVSLASGNADIWVVNSDGSGLRNITGEID